MSKETQKPPCLQVIVTVNGGVADLICKPRGVAVSIYDYDLDGSDVDKRGVSRDPDRTPCCLSEWGASEQIVGNADWPIIKQSIEGTYSRTWRCPGCGWTVECSYDDLAESGNPFCIDCDSEMAMA